MVTSMRGLCARAYGNLNRRIVITAIAVAAIAELALYILALPLGFGFQRELSWAAVVAVPGFAITILTLAQTVALQRGAFVKDYIAQFFLRPELYGTWHDLVYRYSNELFGEVDTFVKQNLLVASQEKSIQLMLSPEMVKKWGNIIIYHPDYFQGSEHERKLDAMLGYLNVIGYYHYRGLVSLKDISGSLGYFLAFVRYRKVVQRYIDSIKAEWGKTDSTLREIHPIHPYFYLELLQDELARQDLKLKKQISSYGKALI
jgi:hypothetical protein